MTTDSITIANTIVAQLGGLGRLRMMIGAKNFIAQSGSPGMYKGGLSFGLPAFGKPRINKIVIMLAPNDTYDVRFYFIRAGKAKLVTSESEVYCDGLKACIERSTGLYLSLGRAA